MLSEDELGRVCVVLVRARNPSNIGAVARAMHDFGFSMLRVVNEFAPPLEAAKSAVDASAVMANAVSYASVADAVADCTLVVGTTAVGDRDLQHGLLNLAEAGPRMLGELRREYTLADDAGKAGASESSGRIAILFGSEKTGLSNDELSHCNWLMTIPMHEHEGVRHPSMNLGQAVAVCLYELVRDEAETKSQVRDAGDAPVVAEQVERISMLMAEVMEKTGYARRHAHNASLDQVRRLVRRVGIDVVDAPVWIGFLKQGLWKLAGESRAADPSAAPRDEK